MQALSAHTRGQALVITLGEALVTDMFPEWQHLYKTADGVDSYVVDFRQTRRIDSSASSMLLLLREHAGGERRHVRLVNTDARIRHDLVAMNFDALFDLA